jgi:hypothetical protein
MSSELHLEGTTITLFGRSDALDNALCDELGRRGCNTHSVSIPMGWLSTTTHAVVRLDTPAGEDAFRELVELEEPPAHVVAVCAKPADELHSARVDKLCRRCGDHHDMSLIWHAALVESLHGVAGLSTATGSAAATTDLAATIADQVADRMTAGPGFASRTFGPPHA